MRADFDFTSPRAFLDEKRSSCTPKFDPQDPNEKLVFLNFWVSHHVSGLEAWENTLSKEAATVSEGVVIGSKDLQPWA